MSLRCGAALVLALSACLTRPTAPETPSLKTTFETVVAQPAIDKIDLLVMVDNSASMADKQRILADAVPDLVRGLVLPKCVDKKTRVPTGKTSDPTKPEDAMCDPGAEPAFPPITDMHVGVISSSMGGFGGSECRDVGGRHNDDHGRLLARGASGPVAAAGDLHFLAWYPDVEKNKDESRHPRPPVPALGDVEALESAFRDLVVGVGQDGCGLEAQLESVYHFLSQPDPWTGIAVDGAGVASYGAKGDVDAEVLRQRAAFLRPDSLVAVIVLTDEDDSSADPLSFAGTGYAFMNPEPRDRPTAACADTPTSSACTSCALAPPGAKGCSPRKYTASEDDVNVRFHHMKQRFGVDPQFPYQRYVDALTKPRVPARDKEHDKGGGYAPAAGCTNPLFAAKLPTSPSDELCDLPRGPRSPGLVYFAIIGGIPNELLGDEPKLDWTKILGRDPSLLDETGIDPHMMQSSLPRPGLPPPSASGAPDPAIGREWTTGGAGLEFACTFDLFERQGTNVVPVRRTCSSDDRAAGYCDCDGTKDAPLCDPGDRSVQVKGKAYPTRRELMVAKDLGDQGVVASLCPVELTKPDADDYGYRPAVRSITARLERSLVGSCLPRALATNAEGKVSCLVLAMLPDTGDDVAGCQKFGLAPPKKAIVDQVRDQLRSDEGEAATQRPICEIPQITVPPGEICRDATKDIAFCYVEAPTVTSCAQALSFSKASQNLTGARFTMQCIELRQPGLPTDN
jgi:hypothetical protein